MSLGRRCNGTSRRAAPSGASIGDRTADGAACATAARRFFGKPAGDLTEDEAARLAAGLPRPSQWHPGVTSRAYQAYVEVIRRRTARAEFLGRLI